MVCPFCGAKLFWSQGQTTEYECNTLITETGLGPTFGMRCLKKQISHLQADLAESEKWQRKLFDDLQDSINKRLELQAEVEAFLKKYNCKRAYAAWQKRKEAP